MLFMTLSVAVVIVVAVVIAGVIAVVAVVAVAATIDIGIGIERTGPFFHKLIEFFPQILNFIF